MISFKRMMINGAAVRQKGGLRFLIQCLPSEKLRSLRLRVCVASAAGFLIFGGCTAGRSEPVLEPYLEESSGQENRAEGDLKMSSAPVYETGSTVSDKSADREGAQSTSQDGSPEGPQNASGKASQEEAQEAGRDSSGDVKPESRGETVTVHVCGAVKKEGVYSLAAGSRVGDAVEAAGGFSKDADTAALNLALLLQDAWQIRVPTKEEAEATGGENGLGITGSSQDSPAAGAEASSGKININTADIEGLMRIPGIGESKARKIIEYREKNGSFGSAEDLMKVPGIKKASFEKMKDFVTVE